MRERTQTPPPTVECVACFLFNSVNRMTSGRPPIDTDDRIHDMRSERYRPGFHPATSNTARAAALVPDETLQALPLYTDRIHAFRSRTFNAGLSLPTRYPLRDGSRAPPTRMVLALTVFLERTNGADTCVSTALCCRMLRVVSFEQVSPVVARVWVGRYHSDNFHVSHVP